MAQSAEEVWAQCLEFIRDNITRQSYKTWFEPLKPVRLEEEGELTKLTIELPSRFYYEWLEEHYFALLRKAISKVLGPGGRLYYDIVIKRDDMEVGYEGASVQLPARPEAPSHHPPLSRPPSDSSLPEAQWNPVPQASPSAAPSAPAAHPFAIPGIQKIRIESNLSPHYTFDRFLEGDCNRLARSAAWAVAQQPGSTSFNPLLIYGGVGLGKTHLIQAVGNYVKQHFTDTNVRYISSERFTSEFVQAIQHNRVSEFSNFYRHIDLLIVDDIQFFSGKEKTQEEFFHIFNTLHQSGKQIILSADCAPKHISGIEERLLSRFQWGLVADIQPPDLETRIAILQRKAEDDGIDIPGEVIEFIATNIQSNIRELEGALIRLLAEAMLRKQEIDLDLAREALSDLIKQSRTTLTIEDIQQTVCAYFNIPEELIRARTRKREAVQARQIAMYFSKQLTTYSLKAIGTRFGKRDHSTVIHACQSVENQIETDPRFREMIREIQHKLELRLR